MNIQPQTKIRRQPDRSVPEEYPEILSAGLVAHVGFVQDGQPYVIPMLYHFDTNKPDRLYLHGAPGSRTIRVLAQGDNACVEVTLVDGLVYSRTAADHSMNYRSVICFGRARRIENPKEKSELFTRMVSRIFSGRTAGRNYRAVTSAELKSTTLLEFRIENFSAKARRGGPNGPHDQDENALGSAGVIELGNYQIV